MRALRVPIVTAMLFAVLWAVGAGAKAQPYPPPTPTVIASLSPPPTAPPSDVPSGGPSVEPSRGPSASPPSDIPFTGADLTRYLFIGAGLTVAGIGFVRIARRPSRDS